MNKLAALALALAFALPPLLVAAPARAKPASAKGRRLDANHGCKDCHAVIAF